jgi:hypothetical protein
LETRASGKAQGRQRSIEAIEKAARAEIDRSSVSVQTELVVEGLTSDAAKTFIERMPTAEALMPSLELGNIEMMVLDERRALSARFE